jgi:Zn-dependent protease with chaperone function
VIAASGRLFQSAVEERRAGTTSVNPYHTIMKKLLSLCALSLALGLPMAGAQPAQNEEGVSLGRMSPLRKLVPAEQLEAVAAEQYTGLTQGAKQKGVLVADSDPRAQRLRRIAEKITPHATRWNERAADWQWEINLIDAPDANAFALPGGKIAFFTGLIDQLKLTDDEIAIVMGHEIAHALREHGRERVAKGGILNLGAALASTVFDFGDIGQAVIGQGAQLTMLKFSRDDETEADIAGLDIVARAGFDPRAGIVLWQKMDQLEKRTSPKWLSTHPAGSDRIAQIREHLPDVLPLYAKAKGIPTGKLPPYRSNVSNIEPIR